MNPFFKFAMFINFFWSGVNARNCVEAIQDGKAGWSVALALLSVMGIAFGFLCAKDEVKKP